MNIQLNQVKLRLKYRLRNRLKSTPASDNRGFTLIELIVCILMLALISGIIMMFVMTSTNSYNIIHNETQMQAEADVALTFINELAVEARAYKTSAPAVSAAPVGTGAPAPVGTGEPAPVGTGEPAPVGTGAPAPDAAGGMKALCIMAPDTRDYEIVDDESGTGKYKYITTDYYYFIWFEQENGKLWFSKVPASDPESLLKREPGKLVLASIDDIDVVETIKGLDSSKKNFLAKYITGFDVTIPNPTDNYPVLRLNIGLEYAGSTFSANKTIASRNLMS